MINGLTQNEMRLQKLIREMQVASYSHQESDSKEDSPYIEIYDELMSQFIEIASKAEFSFYVALFILENIKGSRISIKGQRKDVFYTLYGNESILCFKRFNGIEKNIDGDIYRYLTRKDFYIN